MAIAVSAWLDPQTESQVRDIWKSLHEAGLCSTLHLGPYRPHITLGVYQQLESLSTFTQALHQVAANTLSVECIFASLGIFLNERPVVFLAATVSEPLRALHVQVHQVLAQYGSDPIVYGLPNRWNPHCTLEPFVEKSKLTSVVDFLNELELPIVGTINRLGIIDTPREVELDEIYLLPKA